ncbi:MAG: WG repeat-containing protein [Propionicimonas sp.]
MLWPDGVTVTISSGDGYSTRTTRFGFTDVTGTLVVKPRYESFTYCADAAGRLAWVIGTGAGRKADVLDLTGTVVVTAPAKDAACGTPGTVIFSHWFDAELGHHRDGLLDIASGKVLLPMVPDRHINLVDATTLNVSEPGGEYFLTPRTGARTPHAGWLSPDTGLEAGAPGLPAYQTRPTDDGSGPDPRLGFVGRTGKWVATPAFQDASGFVKGHAVVALGDGHVTFVDTRLQRGSEVSGPRRIDGRRAGANERGEPSSGTSWSRRRGRLLLGTDLRSPIVPGSAARRSPA